MHLDRLIAILEIVAIAGRGLTAAEVQKATGLPRPTCYRLLQTLAKHRLIDELDGSSHYVIGERLIRIALLGKSDIDVRRACAPALKAAAAKFGDTVFLARFRSRQVEIIHVETPDDPAGGFIHPGYDTILPPTGIDAVDAPSSNGIAMCHGGYSTTTKEKGSTHGRRYHHWR